MLSNPLTAPATNDWPKARKLIFVICLVSFVFQLYRITARYYRYETEFQTKLFNGNKEVLDLPAITLCVETDTIFLKSALRKKFPGIHKELEKIDKTNGTTDSEKDRKKTKVYWNHLAKGMTFENYFDRSIKANDFIECYLGPPTKWRAQKKQDYNFWDCSTFSPVLETRLNAPVLSAQPLFNRSREHKCFTFFSRQQSQINGLTDLQVDINTMGEWPIFNTIMTLILPIDKFDDGVGISSNSGYGNPKRNAMYMFIHDPYGVPSFDLMNGIELKAGKYYNIHYWATTKSLLKQPFHSDCSDYHKNLMSKDKPKSRDQCVHDCYVEKSIRQMNCLIPESIVTNDDKLKSYNPRDCLNNDYITDPHKLLSQCRQMCRQDCHKTEYKFESKEANHPIHDVVTTPIGRDTRKFGYIHLKYMKDKESEFRERPVYSMCATIQAMFLALLIWFGLSIFSLSSIFEIAVNKAKPHMYYIQGIEDKVSPSVVSVIPKPQPTIAWNTGSQNGVEVHNAYTEEQMIKPKFNPNPIPIQMFNSTKIESKEKMEGYQEFISKVVEGYPEGYPNAQTVVDLPQKKCYPQY